jgi:hypothetical protein
MTETPDAPVQVTVNIDDFAAALKIIDLASKRGAFTPKEFTAIGEVYSRIEAFLAAHAQMKNAGNTAPATETGG